MNSLEFIDREIGRIESEKKRYLTKFRDEPNDVYLNNFIESLEKKIDYLQQIKVELEAWYVVKPYIEIIDKNTPSPYWNTKPMYDECKLKDTNILIKALEVKE